MRRILITFLLLALGFFFGCRQVQKPPPLRERQKEGFKNGKVEKLKLPETLENLNFPTDLAFAPDGTLYFTEKGGALRVVKEGKLLSESLFEIKVPRLLGYNETGLLGIALSPHFSRDHFIYLYHTYEKEGNLYNRVIRIDAQKPEARPKVILDGILGESIHDGGKLLFDPDGNLYITTGEADQQELSQKKNSLNGKVLRIKPDGTIPKGNPFGNSPVYSIGHRNIFGLTFDDQGRLYVTENGPEENDEINLVEAGKNYGWPEVMGFSKNPRFTNPLIVYRKVNAPTGIIFYTGNLLPGLKNRLVFGDWLEGNLHALTLEDSQATEEIVYQLDEGINALAQAPDGALYATTKTKIVRIERLK